MENPKKTNLDEIDADLTNTYNHLNYLIQKAESLGFKVKVEVKENKLLHTVVDVNWSFP